MNFLDRALPLIARNFSIIPLGANSKAPQKGIVAKQRSTGKKDFQQIESWAQRFPDANVGLVADERFCILESDDYARLAELIRNGTGEDALGEILTAHILYSGIATSRVLSAAPLCLESSSAVSPINTWSGRVRKWMAPPTKFSLTCRLSRFPIGWLPSWYDLHKSKRKREATRQ
ncbi:MAG: hypothetical protein DMG96_26165 [Acidobacteria bacterium]|nr:MAG: hypothetical protein DMG96_26165 [Acidobacteriota bacterium]